MLPVACQEPHKRGRDEFVKNFVCHCQKPLWVISINSMNLDGGAAGHVTFA